MLFGMVCPIPSFLSLSLVTDVESSSLLGVHFGEVPVIEDAIGHVCMLSNQLEMLCFGFGLFYFVVECMIFRSSVDAAIIPIFV